MPTPHDHLVKSIFGDPRQAAQLFRQHLPAEAQRWLDLDHVERVDASFIDPRFTERHADLLFSVKLRDCEERALVYLLFEHQSTPDPLMPFRLLAYMLRIWERWLEEHPGARTLPLILPLVLYHGEAEWKTPLDLAALIDIPAEARAELSQSLPHLTHALLDLSEVPDEDLTDGALTALTLLLLKHYRRGDLVENLERWMETWRRAAQEGGLPAVERVARYIVLVNSRPQSLRRLSQLAGEVLGGPAEEVVMTMGEMLIEKGRRAEAARNLLRALQLRFGEVPEAVQAKLQAAELEALEAWFERIFSAESPEAVVA